MSLPIALAPAYEACMRNRDQGICVRTADFSETSQVVHFFTRENGLVHLIAKGSKRAKSATGGAIDLLSEGDLVWIGQSGSPAMGTMVEFSETAWPTPLRREQSRLSTALFMIELINVTLAEHDPHPQVYDLLHKALERLGQADAPVAAVLAWFQWRLLRHLGLLGQMRSCVACGAEVPGNARDGQWWFSSRQGGLLCSACQAAAGEKTAVSSAALAAMSAMAAIESGARATLTPPQAAAINRLLAYHISQQLSRPLKMARHAIG